MATTTTRSLDDRLGGVARMIRALGRDTTEWDPEMLAGLDYLEKQVRDVRTTVVLGLREAGFSDRQIGEALGITQQAVSKRWPGDGRYQGAAGRYRSGTATKEAVS